MIMGISWLIILKNIKNLKNTFENAILLMMLRFCHSNEFWKREKYQFLFSASINYIKFAQHSHKNFDFHDLSFIKRIHFVATQTWIRILNNQMIRLTLSNISSKFQTFQKVSSRNAFAMSIKKNLLNLNIVFAYQNFRND